MPDDQDTAVALSDLADRIGRKYAESFHAQQEMLVTQFNLPKEIASSVIRDALTGILSSILATFFVEQKEITDPGEQQKLVTRIYKKIDACLKEINMAEGASIVAISLKKSRHCDPPEDQGDKDAHP